MTGSFDHRGETVVHRGHIWTVVVADYEAPDGERFQRDVVRSPGAVGVVALLDGTVPGAEPQVVLVSQYRAAPGTEVIEIPAGMRDVPGEPVEETARRELIEEAGLEARRVVPLTAIYPSPGMTDAVTSIVLATDCVDVERDLQGPEERHMTRFDVPLSEAVAMVEEGRIADAKSVVGILLAARRHSMG